MNYELILQDLEGNEHKRCSLPVVYSQTLEDELAKAENVFANKYRGNLALGANMAHETLFRVLEDRLHEEGLEFVHAALWTPIAFMHIMDKSFVEVCEESKSITLTLDLETK